MKTLCVPILGIAGQVIVNYDTKNRKQQFFARKLLIRLYLENYSTYKAEIRTQCGTWVLMNALYELSLGAPGNRTEILQAENGQKVD